MRIAVTVEHRFSQTPDGAVWTDGHFARAYWDRHLHVFDQVSVIARVREVPKALPAWSRVDGNGVVVSVVPHYIGPFQYVHRAPHVRREIRNSVAFGDSVLLRVSSQISNVVESEIRP